MLSSAEPNTFLNTEEIPRRRIFSRRNIKACLAKSKWIYLLIGALLLLFVVAFGYSLWLQHYVDYRDKDAPVSYSNSVGFFIDDDIVLYEIAKLHQAILRSWYLSGVEVLMISKTAFDAVYNEIGHNLTYEIVDLVHRLNMSINLYVDDWCVVKVNHPMWKNISKTQMYQQNEENDQPLLFQPFIQNNIEQEHLSLYKNSLDKYLNFNITKITFESIGKISQNNLNLDACNAKVITRIQNFLGVPSGKVVYIPTFNLNSDGLNMHNLLKTKRQFYNEILVDVEDISSDDENLPLFENYWKTLSSITATTKKQKKFFTKPPQISTKISDITSNKFGYSNTLIMALFTPGNLILNIAEKALLNSTSDNLTAYIETIVNEMEETSPLHQIRSVKNAFSNDYYKNVGFQITKVVLNDELVLFSRKISPVSRLLLLVNNNNSTISNVNVHQMVGTQFIIDEILLSHSTKLISDHINFLGHTNTTIDFGPSDSVLLIASLVKN